MSAEVPPLEVERDPAVQLAGDAFSIHLTSFDGPLDLLLHLIRKEELDIFDIPISRLTGAYLRYLEALRRLSIEPASEFLVMAATLTQIKSAMLLPRPTTVLVRRLLEYQRFREVARGLDIFPRAGREVFFRPAGLDRPPDPDDELDLSAQDVYRLAEAFRRLVRRGRFTAPHDIWVERISIAERIAQIAAALAETGTTTFQALCETARHREELVTTFLAILEMVRLRLVRVLQGDRLGLLHVEARVVAIARLGEDAAGMLDEGARGEDGPSGL